mmetsp:Transcript_6957/g.8668  ORF Transcript_6957/g.8668 Transcript_6957/m.8668 type:complete len:89 (+) Transcript_6957:159-425(+)
MLKSVQYFVLVFFMYVLEKAVIAFMAFESFSSRSSGDKSSSLRDERETGDVGGVRRQWRAGCVWVFRGYRKDFISGVVLTSRRKRRKS